MPHKEEYVWRPWEESMRMRGRGDEADGGVARNNQKTEAVICAWWDGYGAQHEGPGGQRVLTHMYVTRLKPSRPLQEGEKVRLLAMPKAKTPAPMESIDSYEPYDPHVHGVVIRIVETIQAWARVTIFNECQGNRVGLVDLDIPLAMGVTVWMPSMKCPLEATRWLGEAPRGCGEWKGTEGDSPCRGKMCRLEQTTDKGEGCFRVLPKRTKGKDPRTTIEAPVGEGAFALHLWLKYEGYE